MSRLTQIDPAQRASPLQPFNAISAAGADSDTLERSSPGALQLDRAAKTADKSNSPASLWFMEFPLADHAQRSRPARLSTCVTGSIRYCKGVRSSPLRNTSAGIPACSFMSPAPAIDAGSASTSTT